jgi:hypothetical protein
MELKGIEWLAYFMGSVIVIVSAVIALWSFISFVIVVVRGWFGITLHYKKGELPPNIESAIEQKTFTNKELRKTINSIVSKHESDIKYLMDVLKYVIELESSDGKPDNKPK